MPVSGSASAIARSAGRSSRLTGFSRRSAVAVLPTPFGPSSRIALRTGASWSSCASITRRK